MSLVFVIYYHFKKLSVDQDPRLCNLPNDLIRESSQSVNGLPIKVINLKRGDVDTKVGRVGVSPWSDLPLNRILYI